MRFLQQGYDGRKPLDFFALVSLEQQQRTRKYHVLKVSDNKGRTERQHSGCSWSLQRTSFGGQPCGDFSYAKPLFIISRSPESITILQIADSRIVGEKREVPVFVTGEPIADEPKPERLP